MSAAYIDGTFLIKLRTYTGPSVLVIDDVGITPFDRAQANAFFQVVKSRYGPARPPSSPRTGDCRHGPSSSAATPSWPRPSSTACSTAPR